MRLFCIAFAVCASLGNTAAADVITFSHEGIGGSGTLNGVPFGPADFTITAIGDTSNRVSTVSGYSIDHDSASVSIAGLGSFDFLVNTRTFVNNNTWRVGFSRAGSAGDLFNGPQDNATFSAWDMTSSVGPISGTGFTFQWGFGDIQTTGGVLIFDDLQLPNAFSAVIPSPSSVALLSPAGLVLSRRRRGNTCF